MKKHVYSLRFRLALTILLLFSLLAGAILYNGYRVINGAMVSNVKAFIQQTSNMFNLAVAPYVVENKLDILSPYFSELIISETEFQVLTYAVIANESGKILIWGGDLPSPLPLADQPEAYDAAIAKGVVNIRQGMLMQDNSVGYLQFGLSTRQFKAAAEQALQQGLWLVGIGLIVTTLVMLSVGLSFVRRISLLIKASSAIAQGDYQQNLRLVGQDEIAQLALYFNMMAEAIRQRITAYEDSRLEVQLLNASLEKRVIERTEELATVNQTLSQTIADLKQTQDSLIRSEKLASLGSLVAGVAHELNTPLGNALTVTTTLLERTQEFTVEMEQGLKRSNLVKYIELVQSVCPLVHRNLSRAAELVTSFKHVAVNQSSSQISTFNLLEVVNELIDTLKHTFKNTPYALEVDIPAHIRMRSYPGPLGQVITNFINNALVHAFAEREHGKMLLTAYEDAQQIVLEFKDDGTGISPENIKRIFDPFFSTRFGQGGSGLGLNIVHNIVEGLLGGQINVTSVLDEGTCFTVKIPAYIDEKVNHEHTLSTDKV